MNFSVNLSVTLAAMGKRVGLLDADVFGPSVPLMMNISEEPLVDENNLMIPPINYGVKCLSMGLLVQSGPIVWRGPLVMSALQRLLRGAVWGPLDILIVDTPPGTGDIHLSLTQNVPLSGVLLVSTPQVAALDVTARGAEMYKKFGVPLIGLSENMRHAICGNCKSKIEIFRNVTEKYAQDLGVEVIASIPIDGSITECCDKGMPMALKERDSDYSKEFERLGERILKFIDNKNKK